MTLNDDLTATIALDERALQLMGKLSATRANALTMVADGRVHDVHLRELRGLEAWELIEVSRIFGMKRPHSVWLTDLGKVILRRLEKAQG